MDKDGDCLEFFDKLWVLDPTSFADSVRSNLNSILDHLLELSKKKHGNIVNNIRKTREKLDWIISEPCWSAYEESKLEVELERLLSVEEDY